MSTIRARRSGAALVSMAVACAVAASLLHVYVHLQLIQVGYELARESRARHELTEQSQRLRLELATRKDPAVIERRAREELHMAPPDPASIRVLHVGQSGPIAAASRGH